MLALKINDVKNFMNQLLIGDTFDSFSLVEASITTFSNFTIDGKIHKDFFDTDTVQNMNFNDSDYCHWKEILLFFNHTRQITANTVSNRFSAVSGSVFTIICRFFFSDFY